MENRILCPFVEEQGGADFDFGSIQGFEVDPMCCLFSFRGHGMDLEDRVRYSLVGAERSLLSLQEQYETLEAPEAYFQELPGYFELQKEIEPKRLEVPAQERKMDVHVKVSEDASKDFYKTMRSKYEAHIDIIEDMIQALTTADSKTQNLSLTLHPFGLTCPQLPSNKKKVYSFEEYGMRNLEGGVDALAFADVFLDNISSGDFGDNSEIVDKTITLHFSDQGRTFDYSWCKLNVSLARTGLREW